MSRPRFAPGGSTAGTVTPWTVSGSILGKSVAITARLTSTGIAPYYIPGIRSGPSFPVVAFEHSGPCLTSAEFSSRPIWEATPAGLIAPWGVPEFRVLTGMGMLVCF